MTRKTDVRSATFHDRLADMVRHYCIIGGMPEVVSAYVENRDY